MLAIAAMVVYAGIGIYSEVLKRRARLFKRVMKAMES